MYFLDCCLHFFTYSDPCCLNLGRYGGVRATGSAGWVEYSKKLCHWHNVATHISPHHFFYKSISIRMNFGTFVILCWCLWRYYSTKILYRFASGFVQSYLGFCRKFKSPKKCDFCQCGPLNISFLESRCFFTF